MNKILSFKKDSAFNLMQKAFIIGIIPFLFPAFWAGKYFAILFPTERQGSAEISGNYITFGILIGIGILIVLVLIWKIICQSMLIVLQAFEAYISHHNEK
ncbi:MAG: hypothetical protein JJT76_18505 [Clostridiaceae bacterium]|nr:hypothetical protein [Clostridiaceae bacterium]